MTNIRDYLKEKEKRQQNQNSINYKEKIRSHKLTVFYRIILVVVLVVAISAFAVIQWKNKVYTESAVLSSAAISVVSNANVRNLDGNVLVYSKDGAHCVDASGQTVWNRAFGMQSPLVSVNGATCAIGDYNGREIYVMNKSSEKGTINTNLPIREISVAQNGVVAAVLDDSDVIRINIYDGNQNTDESIVHSKVTMDKSGYPVSISLSPNGKLLMVSYFYADGGQMKSTVAFRNFGEVGKNETDNLVSGFDFADTVIPYVQFMDNDSAFGVSNDRIVFFSGQEKPTMAATVMIQDEEIQGVYYNSSYVGLVFHNTMSEEVYRLDVYNTSGTKVHSQFFNIEYSDILFYNDEIIIYNNSECQISNMKGVDKFTGSFDAGVKLLIPVSKSYKYALVSDDTIDTIELR